MNTAKTIKFTWRRAVRQIKKCMLHHQNSSQNKDFLENRIENRIENAGRLGSANIWNVTLQLNKNHFDFKPILLSSFAQNRDPT